jgi:hypothetical protein
MNVGILLERQMKDLQHAQGLVTEHQVLVEIDPAGADGEMTEMLARPEILGKGYAALAKIGFHRRADDPCQAADVTCREMIAFHETLDVAHAPARGKAHARRDRHLRIEIQPLLRPAGKKVEVASHRPEKTLRGSKAAGLGFAKNALVDDVDDAVGAVGQLGDPEQGVKVAKAALSFLDVRLDHIACGAVLLVTGIAFGELDLGEVTGPDPAQLFLEGRLELRVERRVTADKAHLDQAGQNGVVLARGPDGVGHGAFRMSHLETQVPEKIEELLDNHVGGGVAVRRGQHEKIDVRQWCQLAAAVAPHSDKRKSGIAMPHHDDGNKRFQKLVHAQRMTAHIDSPVAPLFEFGGKVVFQRAVDILCRLEESGTERLVIFVADEPMQGRQPFLRYRQLAVPRRLKRLDPLPPPHDLTGAVRAGRPPCH